MSSFPSVHEPGDVFRDKDGRLWIVTAYTPSPSVQMQRIYTPYLGERTHEDTKRGSVEGAMWVGFVKMEPKP